MAVMAETNPRTDEIAPVKNNVAIILTVSILFDQFLTPKFSL